MLTCPMELTHTFCTVCFTGYLYARGFETVIEYLSNVKETHTNQNIYYKRIELFQHTLKLIEINFPFYRQRNILQVYREDIIKPLIKSRTLAIFLQDSHKKKYIYRIKKWKAEYLSGNAP